jgi:hypothetical protein
MLEPIFMKPGMYIMAPESISMAYFINPYHQFVHPLSLLGNGLVKIPLLLLGNGLVKIPLLLLGNSSVKTLPMQWIHMQQQKNCWSRHFLWGTCHIKRSWQLVLPRTSCFYFISSFLCVIFHLIVPSESAPLCALTFLLTLPLENGPYVCVV